MRLRQRHRALEAVYLAPAVAFTLALVAFPLGRMVQLSFQEYQLAQPLTRGTFVGMGHYIRLLEDRYFWRALGVTAAYTVAVTTFAFAMGLVTALALNRRLTGVAWGRAVLSIPWALPSAIAAIVWLLLLQSTFGVINYLLHAVGLIQGPVQWLLRPDTSLVAIIVVGIWKVFPFNMLVLLAGLQAIPAELYEAVAVDGAGRIPRFRFITWPALKYVSTVALLLTGVHAFREFEQIYILTGGGPGRATETLGVQAYVQAFRFFDFGYGSAIGVVMLMISLMAAFAVVRAMRAAEFY
jgi:multiple sugar transport system permease protein